MPKAITNQIMLIKTVKINEENPILNGILLDKKSSPLVFKSGIRREIFEPICDNEESLSDYAKKLNSLGFTNWKNKKNDFTDFFSSSSFLVKKNEKEQVFLSNFNDVNHCNWLSIIKKLDNYFGEKIMSLTEEVDFKKSIEKFNLAIEHFGVFSHLNSVKNDVPLTREQFFLMKFFVDKLYRLSCVSFVDGKKTIQYPTMDYFSLIPELIRKNNLNVVPHNISEDFLNHKETYDFFTRYDFLFKETFKKEYREKGEIKNISYFYYDNFCAEDVAGISLKKGLVNQLSENEMNFLKNVHLDKAFSVFMQSSNRDLERFHSLNDFKECISLFKKHKDIYYDLILEKMPFHQWDALKNSDFWTVLLKVSKIVELGKVDEWLDFKLKEKEDLINGSFLIDNRNVFKEKMLEGRIALMYFALSDDVSVVQLEKAVNILDFSLIPPFIQVDAYDKHEFEQSFGNFWFYLETAIKKDEKKSEWLKQFWNKKIKLLEEATEKDFSDRDNFIKEVKAASVDLTSVLTKLPYNLKERWIWQYNLGCNDERFKENYNKLNPLIFNKENEASEQNLLGPSFTYRPVRWMNVFSFEELKNKLENTINKQDRYYKKYFFSSIGKNISMMIMNNIGNGSQVEDVRDFLDNFFVQLNNFIDNNKSSFPEHSVKFDLLSKISSLIVFDSLYLFNKEVSDLIRGKTEEWIKTQMGSKVFVEKGFLLLEVLSNFTSEKDLLWRDDLEVVGINFSNYLKKFDSEFNIVNDEIFLNNYFSIFLNLFNDKNVIYAKRNASHLINGIECKLDNLSFFDSSGVYFSKKLASPMSFISLVEEVIKEGKVDYEKAFICAKWFFTLLADSKEVIKISLTSADLLNGRKKDSVLINEINLNDDKKKEFVDVIINSLDLKTQLNMVKSLIDFSEKHLKNTDYSKWFKNREDYAFSIFLEENLAKEKKYRNYQNLMCLLEKSSDEVQEKLYYLMQRKYFDNREFHSDVCEEGNPLRIWIDNFSEKIELKKEVTNFKKENKNEKSIVKNNLRF